MKIGIVGSRDFEDLDQVRAYVRGLDRESVVVSGGARGVDSVAVEEAGVCGLEYVVFEADWVSLGKRAGMMRNEKLVLFCEKVVVFWDGASSGSKSVIELCKKYNVN